MEFRKLDMDTWKRGEIFRHFIDDVRCVIAVTAEVDVTALRALCRSRGLRFYPAYLYVISRAVNRQEALRMGWDAAGNPGIWDEVWPSYVVFHPEDALFTRLVTPLSDRFDRFYAAAVQTMEQNAGLRGFGFAPVPHNLFDVSIVPWLSYQALTLHVQDAGRYLAPIVTAGKYTERAGRWYLPLSIQIHHAAADGWHVSRFYADVRDEIDGICSTRG